MDEPDRTDQGAMDLDAGTFRPPGVDAPRSEWVAYAVFRGLSVQQAESYTRQELIDKFGQDRDG